ncbi:MAG: CcoQ/FixQ family Cbb3-type cytochrome c oxidase assembly chaperone [Chlorobi bacterium]|nr:CcoQ/FixQ family Cbb3-type cytochrome c oxidase assembly chaperone [Chlorobiota bacterium]MCI0715167.1 CcoQ/FixQ family Cbb3-type cytochrome c oxidase assembly chaperone [Chlorobiota bacterium]
MYKHVLQSIEGIEIYPIISLVIFVLFFIAIIIWMFKADKKYLNKMASLPLENSNNDSAGDLK